MEKLLLSNGERGGSENTLRGATLPKQQKQNIRIQFSGLYLASLCIHPSFLWNDQRGKILFARTDRSWGEKFAAAQTAGAEHQTLKQRFVFFRQTFIFCHKAEEMEHLLEWSIKQRSDQTREEGKCCCLKRDKEVEGCKDQINQFQVFGIVPLLAPPSLPVASLHQIMLTLATSTHRG